MRNKLFQLNTMAKKNTLILVCVSLILLVLLSSVAPSLFYAITKNYLTNYAASAVGECSVRMSYILTQHRPAYVLPWNKDAVAALGEYFDGKISHEAANERLRNNLPVTVEGKPSSGNSHIISCINYSVLSTDRGDVFCSEWAKEIAESFVNSGFTDTVPEGSDPVYSVITLNVGGNDVDFLCFTIVFSVAGRVCYSTTLTEFSDIVIQLKTMEKVGLTDYALIYGNNVIYKNLDDSRIIPENYPDLLFEGEQNEVVKNENGDGFDFVVRVTYKNENLRIAVRTTEDEILEPYSATFMMFEVLFIVLILILIVISAVIYRLSLKRLTRLDRKMSSIHSGNFDLVLEDNHNDEIGNLTNTIHVMLERIRSDTTQRIRHEKNERKMQYSLMVSAIDPHFIYNTLDTITFLATMGKTDEIIAVNDALIGTLKDRLSIKNYKTFDTVEKEKKVIEQYMIIQSYLCHNKIDFKFEAGDDVLQLLIPKNIIQPLVENSIKHGLLPNKDETRVKIKDGVLRVEVRHENGMISISVYDNGVGMDSEKISSLLKDDMPPVSAEHIGIANMKVRLAYLYQNNFEIKIESTPGQGTTIYVKFPDNYRDISDE